MTAPMQDSQCTQHKVWFCAFSTEAESQIREPMHLSMRALAEAQWVSKQFFLLKSTLSGILRKHNKILDEQSQDFRGFEDPIYIYI